MEPERTPNLSTADHMSRVDQTDPRDEGPPTGPEPPKAAPSRRRRLWLRGAGVAMAVVLLWLAWSVGGALLAPGTDSIEARLAEWARSNELGGVVDEIERLQYQLNPPAVGGTVAGGIPVISPDELGPGPSTAPTEVAATGTRLTAPSAGPITASSPPAEAGIPVTEPTPNAGTASSPPAPTGTPLGPQTPSPSSAASAPAATGTQPPPPTARPTPRPTPIPTPALEPIPPQVNPSLPLEGAWQTLVSLHGQPAIRAAFLRPDAEHTSYLVGVAWLDQSLLKLVLHPGFLLPGGTGWSQPFEVPPSQRDSLLATFNSGFRMADANGGYWEDGKSAAPLRQGAASMVFYKDGHVDVVKWSAAAPGPDVAAVRQSLVLLVDNGSITPEVYDQSQASWGLTFTGASYVWRTALGIRADGSLVFVVGPAMSVRTLANIVLAAGAVRAMQLDINPPWTNFITYTHPGGGVAVPHMLTRDEQPNPYRYLQPSSRDFVAVLER